MKKALSLLLVFVMLLSLCACGKDDTQNNNPSTTGNTEESTDGTTEATQATTEKPTTAPTEEPTIKPTEAPTTTPTTCSHSYKDATCTAPKTCSKCGATKGSAASHIYSNGVCIYCETAAANYVAFDADSYWEFITLGEDGKLYFYWIGHIDTADGEGSCMVNVCYYEANCSSKYDEKTYNGTPYGMTGGIVGYASYTITNGVITLDLTYSAGLITLAQTAGNKLKVTSVQEVVWDDAASAKALVVGGIFTVANQNNCVIA